MTELPRDTFYKIADGLRDRIVQCYSNRECDEYLANVIAHSNLGLTIELLEKQGYTLSISKNEESQP